MSTKKPFLVCYDYGTGGLWQVIYARCGEEVEQKYPMLSVADARPHWMTDEHFGRLIGRAIDVDDAPNEGLQGMLKEWRSRSK